MNIIAVDDEMLVLNVLSGELKKVFPSDEIYSYRKPTEVLELADKLKDEGEDISYAFLDIKMRGITGLELARRLKIIHPNMNLFFCTAHSEYAIDAFGLYAKGYLMKPITAEKIEKALSETIPEWKKAPTHLDRDVRVQTFGNFEIFVDGKSLKFTREKAKEMLAYLVDRHGASVTTKQIFAVLWEDAPYDRNSKNYVGAVLSSLKSTLKEVGIEDILIKTWNHLAIDVSKIKCDAYDYEKGDISAVNSFHGEYMSNYSWAEFTTGRYVQMELNKSY